MDTSMHRGVKRVHTVKESGDMFTDLMYLSLSTGFHVLCLYNKGMLNTLFNEFSQIEVFARVLRVSNKRTLLHHCFQALMDRGSEFTQKISCALATAFKNHLTPQCLSDQASRVKGLNLGFALGCFLAEAGWLTESEHVYEVCYKAVKHDDSEAGLFRALEYCVRMLHVENANCRYSKAKRVCTEAFSLAERLAQKGISFNRAVLYSEHSALLFAQSLYDEAYKACLRALGELNDSVPARTVIDVLRQCSKACVVKREFKKAEILIKLAVHKAREHFGQHHPKYSDALLDYGFFLLNIDSISSAVQVYQMVLDIRQAVFGGNNLYVAIACEDLAYATYVYEYSSGKFADARDHADKAINILSQILHPNHLLLSSSKRVKALILEEIAIDSEDKSLEEKFLLEAQELHLQSLELARKAFGEKNVQTAKHYGNLGRLYQSMHRFKEAEEMHQKAIKIKEKLLGPDDYEVALSVGHLASLYNYDMNKFNEAEKLYYRSISIGKALFGKSYSGLEYDYRGLLRLYHHTGAHEMAMHYHNVLQEWSQLRDQNNTSEVKPLDFDVHDSVENIVSKHFLS
ncbi:amyloid protein-binding protein 2-like isoform X2 [Pomacea canaliculata]|uniref:amyloid protein-binding protein 2-like isoform X2 n=1 Tax=Pomacea canaliculata TaxID=400727 RepID=UPI000D7303E7|nr:amyloid protein-binding protein 2-like isoform X2 [Pomacea canaliculata]